MACVRPWTGFRWPDGTVRETPGPGSRIELPFEIPCGKCIACRIEKGRQWTIRCQNEARQHKNEDGSSKNAFLTLTYNEDALPKNLSLDKRHWQLFADRMRKEMGPFRYLHVGEYGEENLRPHYHALIFGNDFGGEKICLSEENGIKYYMSPTVAKLWPQGFHIITAMTPETISYVCRYTQKKILGTSKEAIQKRLKAYERVSQTTGEVWEVSPEYATMSLKPGIGTTWWNKYKTDLFPDDFAILKGKQAKVPDFYTRKLEKEDPAMHARVKAKRKKWAADKAADNTPERRLDKQEIYEKRAHLAKARKLD